MCCRLPGARLAHPRANLCAQPCRQGGAMPCLCGSACRHRARPACAAPKCSSPRSATHRRSRQVLSAGERLGAGDEAGWVRPQWLTVLLCLKHLVNELCAPIHFSPGRFRSCRTTAPPRRTDDATHHHHHLAPSSSAPPSFLRPPSAQPTQWGSALCSLSIGITKRARILIRPEVCAKCNNVGIPPAFAATYTVTVR